MFVCEQCFTPEEEQAIDEDQGRRGPSGGEGVDVEAMGETEYEMREKLVDVFYENSDSPRFREGT